MQEITDQLWISDIESVRERPTSRFDRVITVCQDGVSDNVGCKYEHYELADDEIAEKNWGGSADYGAFAEAAQSAVEALRRDEVILIHCHAGQNRSAATCAAALAVYEESGYHDAFGKVGAARPIVNPNQTMKSHAERFIETNLS